MSRAPWALLAVLMLALGLAAPATATPILSSTDATELAESLAEATAEQGVCYGWAVRLDDDFGGQSGVDVGSDKGVDTAPGPDCSRTVQLLGNVKYTCASCESEDSASFTVRADFDGAPTTEDIEALGLSGGNLTSDDNDVVLTNLVGALPLITASKGGARPVPPAEAAELAPGDAPTGSPAVPDWLRENWLPLVFFLLLTVGGIGWLVSLLLAGGVRRTHHSSQEQADG